MSTATATTTAKVYTVVDFAGRTLAAKARKDAAVKYALAQDADAILSPAGKVVWSHPQATAPQVTGAEVEEFSVAVDEVAKPIVLAETGPVTVTVTVQDADEADTDAEMDAPTAHVRPYGILCARLGVTLRELKDLGLRNRPAARAMLAKMDASEAPESLERDIAKVRKAIAEERAARKAERAAARAAAQA